MLSFDIETEVCPFLYPFLTKKHAALMRGRQGLDPSRHAITVACVYDPTRDVEVSLPFTKECFNKRNL